MKKGSERSGAASLDGVHVLIVEDRPTISQLIALAVEAEGGMTAAAGDAPGAIAQARKRKPDVVLLDLLLPGTGGDSLIATLRALPGCATLPVVVLSGAESGLSRSIAAGAEAFLAKPFDIHELIARIRQVLDARTGSPV